MTEIQEELEPLFDYTRVQPLAIVSLDDDEDDDCLPNCAAKRMKASTSAGQEAGNVIDIDDGNDIDDSDWLEPPPNLVVNKEKPCENSVIKELRQTMHELESFTESAKDLVQSVEESVIRDLKTSMDSASESPVEKPSKPAKPVVERPKVVISIQDKDGVKQFRIYSDDKFERLFKMYAEKVKQKVESLVFCFDGDKVDPKATPSSLDMEDEDMLEVHVKSS